MDLGADGLNRLPPDRLLSSDVNPVRYASDSDNTNTVPHRLQYRVLVFAYSRLPHKVVVRPCSQSTLRTGGPCPLIKTRTL